MFLVAHPEVLADDWLPPVPFARERETRELVRRMDAPSPVAPPPWVVAVAGSSGSGTSTVARRAAREVVERLRAAGSAPRLLAVRLAQLRGPHGVATALLRKLDDGFDGRGFPVVEVLAGLLRRLRRDARPVVLLLDDAAVGGPDVGPIVRAVSAPDRFLPEGEHGLPPVWTVLAGTCEGLSGALASARPIVSAGPYVVLNDYDEPSLRAIAHDRAARALGRPAPEALVGAVVARAVADGGGARRVFELLRRELLGGPSGPTGGRRARELGLRVEPHVVDAIGAASRGTLARLGDVRRWEAELARRGGLSPLPTTTLWRRIVRLERAGYVHREIRTGGPGGTLSLLRVLTPIDEWVTDPAPGETRPGAGVSRVAPGSLGAAPQASRPSGWAASGP